MLSTLLLLAALPAAPTLPDYDAFLDSQVRATPAAYSPAARERIEGGWRSSEEPRLGVPTFFWAPRPESEANRFSELGLTPEQAARRWLFLYGELYRQSGAELAAASLQEVHDLGEGAVVVRFHKVVGGVPVFRDTLNVVMGQGLQLVALSGYLSPHARARDFKLTAATAFGVAFTDATGSPLPSSSVKGDRQPTGGWERFVLDTPESTGPARARKVLFPLPERLEAAWQLELSVAQPDGREQSYSYVISAEDGRLLLRQDQVSHASYRVWADDTAPFTPWDGPQGPTATPNVSGLVDGFQAPLIASKLVTVNAIAPVSDPWLPTGATSLSGNNAQVFADLVPPDGYNDALTGNDGGFPPGTFDDGGSDLHVPASAAGVFDYAYDFGQSPDPAPSQSFAGGTSAFYAVNWAHDVLYAHGFDEKAGNGQKDNFGRGGLAGDPMDVAIHAWGGRNNTDMRTPADGAPPRMRAFLFDPAGPSFLYLSNDGGTLDAGALPVGPADFGPQAFDVTAEVARGFDDAGNPWDGCQGPLTNAAEVSGKIVLFAAPNCPFVVAAANAADAGAVGMLITSPNQTVVTMGGVALAPVPPSFNIPRDAGFQLAVRLDGGTVELARMFRPFTPQKDSALDNSILVHEYTHFLTGRLVGDGNGLLNQQGKSLGEGWSDFFALWMMAREPDGLVASNPQWKGTFAIGSYVASGVGDDGAGNAAYYLGVRRYPYSVDFAKNGLTYKHIQLAQALPLVPGAPFGVNTEIHAAGEVWCQMLWEGFVAMVTSPRYNFDEARDRMLGYLVAGLKATPVLPTFLEARDAFLAVVAAKDPLDLQLWMKAFARRGIGIKATGPDRFAPDNSPVVEDLGIVGNFLRVTSVAVTDAPGYCDKDGVLDSGEQGTLTVKVLNVGAGALSASTVTATTTAPGVTFANGGKLTFGAMGPFVPGSASVGISLAGATAPLSIPLVLTVFDPDLTGGSTQKTVTLVANVDQVPAAVEHAEGNVDAWLSRLVPFTPTPVTYEQFFLARELAPGRRAFVGPDVGLRAESDLVTPRLEVGSGPLAVTFQHAYSFEVTGSRTYDGARLELSTDDGASWTPIPGAALTPGYNGAVDPMSSASLQGQPAFVGKSPGYPALVSQQVDLGTAYAGKRVRLRFVISTDTSGGAPGWIIDDVQVSGLTNQPFFDFVKDRAVCVNRPPRIALPADRLVEERTLVDLSPLMVSDPDGDPVTSSWTQLSGPTVVISPANTFTAPEVAADTAMKFKLTATDGTLISEAQTEVTVRSVNRPPTVNPGQGSTVTSGATVALHGSGMDPDGDPLTFSWVQIAGLDVQFANDRVADTTFTAPEVTASSMLTFQLTANDGQANSTQETVTFTVEPKKGGCGCSGVPGAEGLLALVALAASRRRRSSARGGPPSPSVR